MNQPAKSLAVGPSEAFTTDTHLSSAYPKNSTIIHAKSTLRPHFLDFCVDDRFIYLEEPAARRAMHGRYEHVAFNLLKWEGAVYLISTDDLTRRGRYGTDRTGDRLWRVPRRVLKAVRL